jgi:hypothetical protein
MLILINSEKYSQFRTADLLTCRYVKEDTDLMFFCALKASEDIAYLHDCGL